MRRGAEKAEQLIELRIKQRLSRGLQIYSETQGNILYSETQGNALYSF